MYAAEGPTMTMATTRIAPISVTGTVPATVGGDDAGPHFVMRDGPEDVEVNRAVEASTTRVTT